MKRVIAVAIVGLLAFAGCQQQPREQKGQAGLPAGPMMKSPQEIRQLEDLAKQAPKNPEAWIMLGNALMDSQRFVEAVDAYQKGLALDPRNVNARVDMGTCYRNSGQPKKAIEEYKKALRIEPNHINANRNMGVVLAFDLNARKNAAKSFEKYLQLSPLAADAAEIRQLIQNLKSGQ